MDEDEWFAVRCVFESDRMHTSRDGPPPDHLYEERITLWQSVSMEAAIERAEIEAVGYAADVGARYLGLAQAFAMYDAPDNSAEVFSLMRDSDLDPTAYLSRHFDTGSERAH
jgi:hypothetical protein